RKARGAGGIALAWGVSPERQDLSRISGDAQRPPRARCDPSPDRPAPLPAGTGGVRFHDSTAASPFAPGPTSAPAGAGAADGLEAGPPSTLAASAAAPLPSGDSWPAGPLAGSPFSPALPFDAALYFSALTSIPGRSRCIPARTTQSPGLTPFSTSR